MTAPPPPDLSVVIPVRDGGDVLRRAVASVLAQRGPAVEVVVVDDGSTDGAPGALEGSDGRLVLVRQPWSGVAAARNAGVARSRAPAVAFLDADDEVLPGWADALVGPFADATVGVVSCAVRVAGVPETDPAAVVGPEPLGPAFGGITARFLAGSFAVRRTVLDAAGGYRAELRFGENTELGLRLAATLDRLGLRAVAVPRPLVLWHRATVRRHPPLAVLESTELVLREHRDAFGRDPAMLADHHGVAGVNAARVGDPSAARRHFLAAARARPRPRTAGRLAVSLVGLARRAWPPIDRPPQRRAVPGSPRPLVGPPTATVVVPCHDAGPFLLDQLRALESQLRDGETEVVVVDDGSTDGSVEAALAGAGPLVRSLRLPEAVGPAGARNAGVATSDRDAVVFVDADDRVQPGYLDAVRAALREQPLVAARVSLEHLNAAAVRASRDIAQVRDAAEGLHPWGYGGTLALDRQLFLAAGGFDEGLRHAEDVDLCYRIQERFDVRLRFVADAVVDYRLKTGARATFRQARLYGRGGPEIYLRHRRFGLRRDPLRRAVRVWLGNVRVVLRPGGDEARRLRALFVLGARLGRLEGSLRRRVWYP